MMEKKKQFHSSSSQSPPEKKKSLFTRNHTSTQLSKILGIGTPKNNRGATQHPSQTSSFPSSKSARVASFKEGTSSSPPPKPKVALPALRFENVDPVFDRTYLSHFTDWDDLLAAFHQTVREMDLHQLQCLPPPPPPPPPPLSFKAVKMLISPPPLLEFKFPATSRDKVEERNKSEVEESKMKESEMKESEVKESEVKESEMKESKIKNVQRASSQEEEKIEKTGSKSRIGKLSVLSTRQFFDKVPRGGSPSTENNFYNVRLHKSFSKKNLFSSPGRKERTPPLTATSLKSLSPSKKSSLRNSAKASFRISLVELKSDEPESSPIAKINSHPSKRVAEKTPELNLPNSCRGHSERPRSLSQNGPLLFPPQLIDRTLDEKSPTLSLNSNSPQKCSSSSLKLSFPSKMSIQELIEPLITELDEFGESFEKPFGEGEATLFSFSEEEKGIGLRVGEDLRQPCLKFHPLDECVLLSEWNRMKSDLDSQPRTLPLQPPHDDSSPPSPPLSPPPPSHLSLKISFDRIPSTKFSNFSGQLAYRTIWPPLPDLTPVVFLTATPRFPKQLRNQIMTMSLPSPRKLDRKITKAPKKQRPRSGFADSLLDPKERKKLDKERSKTEKRQRRLSAHSLSSITSKEQAHPAISLKLIDDVSPVSCEILSILAGLTEEQLSEVNDLLAFRYREREEVDNSSTNSITSSSSYNSTSSLSSSYLSNSSLSSPPSPLFSPSSPPFQVSTDPPSPLLSTSLSLENSPSLNFFPSFPCPSPTPSLTPAPTPSPSPSPSPSISFSKPEPPKHPSSGLIPESLTTKRISDCLRVSYAVSRFNAGKVNQAVDRFCHLGVTERTPKEVAIFLESFKSLSPLKISEFISDAEKFNSDVLLEYMALHSFAGLDFELAMRRMLKKISLPGEGQRIDRILKCFGYQYFFENKSLPCGVVFKDQKSCHSLSFALIMLNTDLHNPNVPNKMTPEQFENNLLGYNCGSNFPGQFLREIYVRIAAEGILQSGNQADMHPESAKEGWLKCDESGSGGKLKLRYVVLLGKSLLIYKKKDLPHPPPILELSLTDIYATPLSKEEAKGHKCSFLLHNACKKVLFCAKTQESVFQWLTAVEMRK